MTAVIDLLAANLFHAILLQIRQSFTRKYPSYMSVPESCRRRVMVCERGEADPDQDLVLGEVLVISSYILCDDLVDVGLNLMDL